MQNDLSTNHGDIPIRIFAINRSDVSVDEALAEQYGISLLELWEGYFGTSSPSPSVLPFVNDSDWLIWSDWGEDCPLQDEAGNPLHATTQEHWRDLYILDPNGEVHAVYNLTDNNLSDSSNYDAIKNIFLEAYQTD
jgi:hypothetical protein